jgi:hypothetical protein
MPRGSIRRRSLRKRTKGGNFNGAADYAQKVYGNTTEQHAAGPNTNVIAMKQVGGKKQQQEGGKKQQQQEQQQEEQEGGNVLSDIAVPVTLIYANHTFGKRKSTKRPPKSRRFRKSRRFSRSRR